MLACVMAAMAECLRSAALLVGGCTMPNTILRTERIMGLLLIHAGAASIAEGICSFEEDISDCHSLVC